MTLHESYGTDIRFFNTPGKVARAAADFILTQIHRLPESRRFSLALSGGSTPQLMYSELAAMHGAAELLASRVEIFFSDERPVGPEHEESNFRSAHQNLFDPLSIPDSIVHRMRGEAEDLALESARYAALIEQKIARVNDIPSVDLTILGMGPDGHTASLFPDFDFTNQQDKLVVAPYVLSKESQRISFSLKLINASRQILFLVTGAEKSEKLARVLTAGNETDLPAARVRKGSNVIWMVDKAAAAQLSANNIGVRKP